MARGGQRQGAGRKSICPIDQVTLFCGAEFEKRLAWDFDFNRPRFRRALDGRAAADADSYDSLIEYWKEQKSIGAEDRREYLRTSTLTKEDNDLEPLPIHSIRHIQDNELGGVLLWTAAPLSNNELGSLYGEIAKGVQKRFQQQLSRRQVKRRIQTYQKALYSGDV
jgi:hypothetical protein